jgi:HK97 family phage portal protein
MSFLVNLSKRFDEAQGLAPIDYASGQQVIDMPSSGSPLVDLVKSKTWSLLENTIVALDHVPRDGDYRAFLNTYAVVPWMYVATWVKATSLASRPLEIMEGPPDEAQVVTTGSVYDLFVEPNEFDSTSDLIEITGIHAELTGNAYWEKNNIINNLPLKLFSLEPDKVDIVPSATKKIERYDWVGTSGQKEPFEPEEISHFKYSNPLNQFYGQGTVKVLQTTLITELMRETYNKNFLENEARPDVILKQNPDVHKGIPPVAGDQLTTTAKMWRRSFGGPRKNRLPVVLPAGFDVDLLTEQIQDMNYREMEKSLRERILGASGVPPALVGLFEFANYANSKEQIKIFWTVFMPPMATMLSETITRTILRPFDRNLWCRFNMDNIPALAEDVGDMSTRLQGEFDRGWINTNKARELMGYGQDPNDKFGDRYVVNQNYVPKEDIFAGEELTGEE